MGRVHQFFRKRSEIPPIGLAGRPHSDAGLRRDARAVPFRTPGQPPCDRVDEECVTVWHVDFANKVRDFM